MKLYLAGPMSGLPDFNYPEFRRWKRSLEKVGYRVTSPADLGMESSGYTWNDCMRSAITKMLECDAISLLDGWENSKGAKIELEIAKKLSMPIYTPGTLVEPAK